MQLSEQDLLSLKNKVKTYTGILSNTDAYRQKWKEGLKEQIRDTLQQMIDFSGLEATIVEKNELNNLEALLVDLGQVKSGLSEKINDEVNRTMIKYNGGLIYQQLFNGKIIVLIQYPYIENYGKPRPPKTIAIYRPEELKEPYFIRHMETFVTEVTNWEDFDDDDPQKKIGFELNFNNDRDLES